MKEHLSGRLTVGYILSLSKYDVTYMSRQILLTTAMEASMVDNMQNVYSQARTTSAAVFAMIICVISR